MSRKLILLFITVLFALSCQSRKEEELLKKFSDEYNLIQNRYEENVSATNSKEQVQTLYYRKADECAELLKKYGNQVSSDPAELLKSKLYIECSRFDEAELIINQLIDDDSSLINDAKMAKVQILIYREKPDEALLLLREIQDNVQPGLELLSAYLYFALYSKDPGLSEEYGHKFLDSPAIPRSLSVYTPDVNRALAFAALLKNDREGAVSLLEKAIAETSDREKKTKWELELARLGLIGNPAPPIFAESWLNSNSLDLALLKDRVVVIAFWAPWSNYCRLAIPKWEELYGKYKDRGLVIIGLTKLYGNYKDETGERGIVNDKDEVALIKEFLARNRATFPIAVSNEANNSEKYKIEDIPALVFIDKKGKVAHILVGGQESFIENKIKQQLEEN
jgi:thiol-disulfide isomerase/thioredoxin